MKSVLSSLAVLAACVSSISAQIAVGGECGGSRYQGTNLCEDGAYCALITDDYYQCLKLEDIYAKETISFILTSLPTFTFATVKPTKTLNPTFTLGTPCPTVTVTTTQPPVTYTTTSFGTVTTVLTKTLVVTSTQSCSSTVQTTTTIPTQTTPTTTTTTTTPTKSSTTTITTQTTIQTTIQTTTPTTTTTATTTSTTMPCQSLQPEYPAGRNFTYKGVNIAGFEFGCKSDGTCTPPYSSPLDKPDGCGQMKWFYSRGMNTFRLPIGWQYATPTLGGSFDPTNWGSYDKLMQCCLALPGAYCVVDIHNWARWNGAIIGQGMSDSPYIKLWQMIASYYASEPRVIFGLMNEPWKLNLSAWAATLQRVVNAIRPIAPRHVILLPGIEYAHADTFLSSGTAAALDAIINPDGTKNNLLFDLHQWLDKGNLGTSSGCITDNIAVFTPIVSWLRCNKRKAFLSATGGGNAVSDNCMAGPTYMCKQMSYLFSNSDVIVGYTGWAAGSYDTTYIYDETPMWTGTPWVDTPLVATCMYWP